MRKERKRKALAALVCGSMLAVALTGGTLAYLKAEDHDVNVMTLGNVSIEQHEYQRVVENGSYKTATIDDATSYVLEDFTQGKALLPATELNANGGANNFGAGGWDTTKVKMTQVDSYGSMDVFSSKNAQDKFVTVENTGKSDAYVRTLVAFELGDIDAADFDKVIGFSSRSTEVAGNFNQPWLKKDVGVVEIDGNNYVLVEFVYHGAELSDGTFRHESGVLPAGDTSYPSLCQVYMKSAATNDDVEAIDGNNNGTYDILVFSQAVQTEGFADAETALDTAFGDITTDEHPWADEPEFAVVDSSEDLIAALEGGEDVVMISDVKIDPASMSNAYGTTGINVKNGQTIDGGGHTLDIKGAGGTWDSGINTTGGIIKNLTVTGSFRGIFVNHNSTHSEPVILENVTIDGTTYTISCDQGMNQTLKATDSTFNGWTSFAGTLGSAEFIDCSFGEGNGYAYCRPYAPTAFVNCDFEAGYRIDARAAVTFENCTIGGVALTQDNLATLVVSNIANATVL